MPPRVAVTPPPAAPSPGGRASALALVLIVLAGLVAYHNSLSGAFVFDDQGAILDNTTIRRLWPPAEVLSPPIHGLPVTGRPLTNLSFAVNYALHGTRPLGFHLVNLGIHLAAGLTLFGLIRLSLASGSRGVAAVAPGIAPPLQPVLVAASVALLWVVHPLTTGGVTYISQRAESLASLLVLFALYGFARGLRSPRPRPWLIAVAIATWAAIGVKEFAATIPILLALYAHIFGYTSWRTVFARWRFFFITLAASWIPLLWLVLGTNNRGGTWAGDSGYSPWDYLLIQARALIHYLRLVFWPAPLVFDYGRNVAVPPVAAALIAGAAVLALLGLVLLGLRRGSAAAFCGAVFFLILAPTSSFLPIADPIFEHRMYLPAAAVLAVGVGALYRFTGHRIALVVVLPAAVVLTFITINRNRDFHSPLTLWGDTVSKRPENARARGNYGKELLAAGDVPGALQQFQAAAALTPDHPVAVHNLASALDQAGQDEAAIVHYRRALALAPNNHLARTALGRRLLAQGDLPAAVEAFTTVVAQQPDFLDGRIALSEALLRAQRPEEALVHLKHAVAERPADARLHFSLGECYARLQRLDPAIASFREAVRLQRDFTGAWNNLGNALLLRGHPADAVEAFQSALRLEETATTHANLGLAYLLLQQRSAAIQHFEAALALEPNHTVARSALTRLGRIPAR